MNNTTRSYIIPLVVLGWIVILIAQWRAILQFGVGLFDGKYYIYRYYCSRGDCITIANETGFSFNSYVDRYIFIGKFEAIPLIDHDFMKFTSDPALCIAFDSTGHATIYAPKPPDVNHISDSVTLGDSRDAPTDCPGH